MASRIEDYALICDRLAAAWSAATGRSTGCASRASTRTPASPPCSATEEQRPLADRAARRRAPARAVATAATRWCWRRMGHPGRAPSGSSTSCPNATTPPTSCASSRASRARSTCAASCGCASATATSSRGCATSRACSRRSPARTRCGWPPTSPTTARTSRRTPTSSSRPASAVVRAHLAPVVPGTGRPRSTRSDALDETERFWQTGPTGAPTTAPTARPCAVAAHPQGAHLRADRRHHRRRDHLAARGASAACATGTTATAGCATRLSRCRRW